MINTSEAPEGSRTPVLHSEWNQPLRAQRDPLVDGSGRPRANRDQRRQVRKQSWLGRFLATYGWRAYALPVLVVLTGVVLYQTMAGTPVESVSEPVKGPPTLGASGTAIIGAPPQHPIIPGAHMPCIICMLFCIVAQCSWSSFCRASGS